MSRHMVTLIHGTSTTMSELCLRDIAFVRWRDDIGACTLRLLSSTMAFVIMGSETRRKRDKTKCWKFPRSRSYLVYTWYLRTTRLSEMSSVAFRGSKDTLVHHPLLLYHTGKL